MPTIVITARRAGWRRAGLAHSTSPTRYPLDRFTAEQLGQLQADPQLICEVIDDAEIISEAAPGAKRGAKRPADEEAA